MFMSASIERVDLGMHVRAGSSQGFWDHHCTAGDLCWYHRLTASSLLHRVCLLPWVGWWARCANPLAYLYSVSVSVDNLLWSYEYKSHINTNLKYVCMYSSSARIDILRDERLWIWYVDYLVCALYTGSHRWKSVGSASVASFLQSTSFLQYYRCNKLKESRCCRAEDAEARVLAFEEQSAAYQFQQTTNKATAYIKPSPPRLDQIAPSSADSELPLRHLGKPPAEPIPA